MASYPKKKKKKYIPSAPTDPIFYPETDGNPMAVSDLHRRIHTRTIETLDEHFKHRPEVYVSGDILMYYVEGIPEKVIAPDVLVTFGMGKELRLTYRVWEEDNQLPAFVMEFASKTTYYKDLGPKMLLYASLGIPDYFLYDMEGLYLPFPLMGFTLVQGFYVPISPGADGGLHSVALGLDFHFDSEGLGIYDPVAGAWLQTPAESANARAEIAETRAETAETRAQTAEARAEQETLARQKVEAEFARLREELARLQTRSS